MPTIWQRMGFSKLPAPQTKEEKQDRALQPDAPVWESPDGQGYSEYSFFGPSAELFNENILLDLLDGKYSKHNYLRLFESVPEVFSAVNEIASRVAAANWQLLKTWNDEIDYNNQAFNRLFSQPNPIDDVYRAVYMAVVYEICTGRQFFWLNRPEAVQGLGPDGVLGWGNLSAPDVTVVQDLRIDPYTMRDISDAVTRYEVPTITGGTRRFDTRLVYPIIHRATSAPDDLNQALPLIKGADMAIRNLIPVYEARGHIYIKRGALGAWVSRKTDASGMRSLTPGEKKEILAENNRTYGLSKGKYVEAVYSAPMDYVKSSSTIKDMEPFSETVADAIAIYAALRIPRHLVPMKDQSTYANAASDEKAFYEKVIIPWAEKYARIWSRFMGFEDARRYIKPSFKDVAVLQEDKKAGAETAEIMGKVWYQRWKSGVCTLNDWLADTGQQAVNNPLYTKKFFEFTTEDLENLKNYLNLNANAATPENTSTQAQPDAAQGAQR